LLPTSNPTPQPTAAPTPDPTSAPTDIPTESPTTFPTELGQGSRQLWEGFDYFGSIGFLSFGHDEAVAHPLYPVSASQHGVASLLTCAELPSPCIWKGQKAPMNEQLTFALLEDESGLYILLQLGDLQELGEASVHVFSNSPFVASSRNGVPTKPELSENSNGLILCEGRQSQHANQALVGPFMRLEESVKVCFEFERLQHVHSLHIWSSDHGSELVAQFDRKMPSKVCIKLSQTEEGITGSLRIEEASTHLWCLQTLWWLLSFLLLVLLVFRANFRAI
jgi:hypothetical protein